MTAVKFKIKKGDTVIVRCGKDKGKKGEVLSVLKETSKVLVKGVRVVKRHTKPTQTNAGGIVQKELPIHISNVSLMDPKDGKPTKVGIKIEKNGTKTRIARKSGESI